MKDIDKLLLKNKPTPGRPLKASFAMDVADKIRERNTQKKHWHKRLFAHKPAFNTGIALLLLAVVTGGTVAALTLWPRPEVDKAYVKELPNGNSMVAISSKNCLWGYQKAVLDSNKEDFKYYEIRKGASISVDELIKSIKASCEEDNNYAVTSRIIEKMPKHDAMNTIAHRVEDITSNTITVSLDPQYKAPTYIRNDHLTYRLAKDIKVYDGYNKTDLKHIKKGDTVVMVARDTSGRSSEEPGNNNPLGQHPENILVLDIVKVPPLSGNPGIFSSAFAVDIVRLEPCTTDPSGFCRAYDFAH